MSKPNESLLFCSKLYRHPTPTAQSHPNFAGEDIPEKIVPCKEVPKISAPIEPSKPILNKYLEHQVPDKSCSFDFPSRSANEYLDCYGIPAKPFPPTNTSSETELPLSRPAPEMKLSGDKNFSPSTAADRMKSTQLSPQTKRLTISDPEAIPRPFCEPFNQKFFHPQVPEITCSSDIVVNSNEYNIGDERTSEKAKSPIKESSQTQVKSPYPVFSRCSDSSLLLNKSGTENFPSRITEYLSEQNRNIADFKSRVCDFLLHQIVAIKNGASQSMSLDNITEYGRFVNSSIFLSHDDLAEMEDSNDKVHLKNMLQHNASTIKYLKEQNSQLSLFANHAIFWLEKAREETKEHLKLLEKTTTVRNSSASTETAEKLNDSTLGYQNKRQEKKKVADSSTMTSPVISDDDSSSEKISGGVKESGNNIRLPSHNKKIAKVCNVSTMTESAIKMKHAAAQSRKHKNMNVESSPEVFKSCGKNNRKLKEPHEASTMTDHFPKRKTTPKDGRTNKGEKSGNIARLHSCDKKSQKVKCCHISTTTDDLVPKTKCNKRKSGSSNNIEIAQNVPISCCEHGNKSKQCPTSTRANGISDFEDIIDNALSALVEAKSDAEDSDESNLTLREFSPRCCQKTEEKIENQSLVSEESRSDLNSSTDSSSSDENVQISAKVSYHNSKRHESTRSTHSANSQRKDSTSKGFETSNVRKTKSPSCNCSQENRSPRVEKGGDSSSTNSDVINKDKEVHGYSRSIEMYGLRTPDLSFATIDYLTRHGLVYTSSKNRSSLSEKK